MMVRGFAVAIAAVAVLVLFGPSVAPTQDAEAFHWLSCSFKSCPTGTFCVDSSSSRICVPGVPFCKCSGFLGFTICKYDVAVATCVDDPNYCGTGAAAVRVGQCSGSYYCDAPGSGTLSLVNGRCGYSSGGGGPIDPPTPPPLAITSITESLISSNRAIITWVTNTAANGKVRYGLTDAYELGEVVDPLPDSTGHSVELIGLSPGTTYHYQVESRTPGGDLKTSVGDRFFTTTGSGTSGPGIISGPFVDATDLRASVSFRTDTATAAMVEYTSNPVVVGPPVFDKKVCNDPANCPAIDPDWPVPNVLRSDHRMVMDGLAAARSTYRYRITIRDAGGATFVSGEFEFTTSAGSTDHVFTTGTCSDAAKTPLLSCTADGKYCPAGGGEPQYDCRPDIPCPRPCDGGFTCQASGRCLRDPSLSGSPTQCNPKKCYQKCDSSSGGKSGDACSIDADCDDGSSAGKCTTGTFTEPAVGGCYASWPACSANTILQVQPDRVCNKWLTCKTSQPIRDATGKTENVCFNLTMCGELDQTGQCSQIIEGRQCSNDPLRFCVRDSDCIGVGAKCLPPGTSSTLTFRTPVDVEQIQNLTGYSKAGLSWEQQSGSPKITGYYPLSMAKQTGSGVEIPNAGFEEFESNGSCLRDSDKRCSNETDCQKDSLGVAREVGPCVYKREYTPVVRTNWEAIPAGGTLGSDASVSGSAELNLSDKENNFLVIKPKDGTPDSGARSTFSMLTSTTQQYILNIRLRAQSNDLEVKVELVNTGGVTKDFGTQLLTTGWQTFRLGPVSGPGGPSELRLTTPVATTPGITFYVDDLAMVPALDVNGATLISQSCRLYPNDTAPACNYIDQNGVSYRGLKGYCLERDPLNEAVCISWWPVDVVAGDNIFGTEDEFAGYDQRRPLYACTEAYGLARINSNTETSGIATTPAYRYGPAKLSCGHPGVGCCVKNRSGDCNALADNQWSFITPSDSDRGINRNPPIAAIPSSYADYHLPQDAIREVIMLNKYDSQYPTVHCRSDHFTPSGTRCFASGGGLGGMSCGGESFYLATSYTEGDGDRVWFIDNPNLSAGGCTTSNQLNGFILKLIFTPQGELKEYQFDGADITGGRGEGTWWTLIFDVKEICKSVVEVASADKDRAWVDRTSETSTYVVPELNYRRLTDLEPFGGAVVASGAPSTWRGVLPFESAQTNTTLLPPYQERGGSPFACIGDCSIKLCYNAPDDAGYRHNPDGRWGQPCSVDTDCTNNDGTTATCKGVGYCAKFDGRRFVYPARHLGRPCADDATCSAAFGVDYVCIGGGASFSGDQSYTGDGTSPSLTDNARSAQFRLQRLFAQALSLWEWNGASGKYEKQTSPSVPWLPPDKACKICDAGAQKDRACKDSGECNVPIIDDGNSCVVASRHPTLNVTNILYDGTPDPDDYCAIKPRVTNISDSQLTEPIEIGNGQLYTLKFNSNVDREQTPLRAVRIDWGDEVTVDSKNAAPRDDPNNPHLYTHAYNCNESSQCTFTIRIQIEDNWGWCDNGTDGTPCEPRSSFWTAGPTIIVRR